VSDIDTVAVDSLKALDPNGPIREADMKTTNFEVCSYPKSRQRSWTLVHPPKAKNSHRAKFPHSLRRHYDGDGMRRHATDFDDEWRRGQLEFHALADALATRRATERPGFHRLTILHHVNPGL
jgi:hypothetical protein